jgi:hypothetical protein
MDIEGTVERFLNPVDKYGTIIGVGADIFLSGENWVGNIQSSLQNIANGQLHAPEWDLIIGHIEEPEIVTAIAAAVGGYFVKEGVSNSMIKKLASIVQKIATGFVASDIALAILYYSTHSPSLGNDQGQGVNAGYSQVAKGSSLGSGTGGQKLAPYQSVYPSNPTAGGLYTVTSGARLVGN